MLILEGYVSKSGVEKWENPETKKSGESFKFAIEGMSLILDNSIDPADVPAVGSKVRAMVNRVFSPAKKKEYFFVLGFQNAVPVA